MKMASVFERAEVLSTTLLKLSLGRFDGSAVGNAVNFGEAWDAIDPVVSMVNEENRLTICKPRVLCDGDRGS